MKSNKRLEYMNCVFCKIITGEIGSSKVYEDKEILAFMDNFPFRTGQVLVIPKKHIDHFSDIPDKLAVKIFLKGHQISKIIKNKLKPERMGLVVHGYGVPHAHMIIVPQCDKNDITTASMAKIEKGKIVFTSENLAMIPLKELRKIATIIKNGLTS